MRTVHTLDGACTADGAFPNKAGAYVPEAGRSAVQRGMKECVCGLVSPDSSRICDCGRSLAQLPARNPTVDEALAMRAQERGESPFAGKSPAPSRTPAQQAHSIGWGWFLAWFAVAISLTWGASSCIGGWIGWPTGAVFLILVLLNRGTGQDKRG